MPGPRSLREPEGKKKALSLAYLLFLPSSPQLNQAFKAVLGKGGRKKKKTLVTLMAKGCYFSFFFLLLDSYTATRWERADRNKRHTHAVLTRVVIIITIIKNNGKAPVSQVFRLSEGASHEQQRFSCM